MAMSLRSSGGDSIMATSPSRCGSRVTATAKACSGPARRRSRQSPAPCVKFECADGGGRLKSAHRASRLGAPRLEETTHAFARTDEESRDERPKKCRGLLERRRVDGAGRRGRVPQRALVHAPGIRRCLRGGAARPSGARPTFGRERLRPLTGCGMAPVLPPSGRRLGRAFVKGVTDRSRSRRESHAVSTVPAQIAQLGGTMFRYLAFAAYLLAWPAQAGDLAAM